MAEIEYGSGRPRRRWMQRTVRAFVLAFRVVFVLVLLLAAAMAFGTSGGDYTRLRTFTGSVVRWQHNPEFRTVAYEYVNQGSDAMRSEPFGITAASWIMWIRSLPCMPKEFAVSDTSRLHYQNFSRGPLSAYLHLCTEQDLLNEQNIGGYLGEMQNFGDSAGPDDARLHKWLAGLQWNYTVCSDAGAVQSLKTLIRQIEPSKPFKVQVRHIDQALRPHIATLATELQIPTSEPELMTFDQQSAVLDRLDAHVRDRDPELWRTKQVSDFVGGIWAQVFGPPYNVLLVPYLQIIEVCRWILLGMLCLMVMRFVMRGREAETDVEISLPEEVTPAPAPNPA